MLLVTLMIKWHNACEHAGSALQMIDKEWVGKYRTSRLYLRLLKNYFVVCELVLNV